jgi:uncharacterized membrane protein (UPF0127 family)
MSMISDLILVGESELSSFNFCAAKDVPENKITQLKTMKKFDMKFDLKRFTIFVLICAGIGFVLLQNPKEIADSELKKFNHDFKNYNANLEIFDGSDHKIASFKVAIADTKKKKMYGLMNLDYMPQNNGMVFTFDDSQVVTMWMKNTRISLDMIFIDADDDIAWIANDTIPHSLNLISSQKEVVKVLEINAGLATKLGIKIGQKVRILKQ